MKRIFANNINKIAALGLAALIFSMAGCGSADSPPDYLTPEAGGGQQGEAPPVNEQLASEAWQQRLVYHVGPMDLPAGTAPALDNPLSIRFQTDEPVWITGFVPRVVDSNGSELPAALLHEAIVSNMHEENPLCGGGGGGNPIFIATSMLTEVELPEGYGYPILSTDPIDAQVIFANPTEQSYAGVQFELTLVARPMNEFTQVADVKPLLVEPDPCTHQPLKVEPGAFTEKSATYQMPDAVKVVVAQGALQNFGASIELIAGSEATPFWRAEAKLDEAHQVVELTDNPFTDPKGVPVKQGDSLTLLVTYDNTSEKWLDGATAAAMVYAAPTE
ncbi:MAG: hypothetical protein WC956_01510 [bacterium]